MRLQTCTASAGFGLDDQSSATQALSRPAIPKARVECSPSLSPSSWHPESQPCCLRLQRIRDAGCAQQPEEGNQYASRRGSACPTWTGTAGWDHRSHKLDAQRAAFAGSVQACGLDKPCPPGAACVGWVPDRHQGSCLLATARYTPSYSTRLQWKVSCLPQRVTAPADGVSAALSHLGLGAGMHGSCDATRCSHAAAGLCCGNDMYAAWLLSSVCCRGCSVSRMLTLPCAMRPLPARTELAA